VKVNGSYGNDDDVLEMGNEIVVKVIRDLNVLVEPTEEWICVKKDEQTVESFLKRFERKKGKILAMFEGDVRLEDGMRLCEIVEDDVIVRELTVRRPMPVIHYG
jgi:hypothetical protein